MTPGRPRARRPCWRGAPRSPGRPSSSLEVAPHHDRYVREPRWYLGDLDISDAEFLSRPVRVVEMIVAGRRDRGRGVVERGRVLGQDDPEPGWDQVPTDGLADARGPAAVLDEGADGH